MPFPISQLSRSQRSKVLSLLSFPFVIAVVAITVAMIVGDYHCVQALRERVLDNHLRWIDGGLPVRHEEDNNNGHRWRGGGGG